MQTHPRWIPLLALLLAACARPSTSAAPADVAAPNGGFDVKLAGNAPSPARNAAPDPAPVAAGNPAVVVELFSSEGCSSCPPADVVLRDLALAQPVAGAEIVALELHVDYWNDLGWPDPFSSEAFTTRQRAYVEALGDRSMYTPEMVVDGQVGFVGSQASTARSAVARAAKLPKARVMVERSGDTLALAVSDLPEGTPAADVMLALAEEGLSTDVKRGENAGSVLAHGPIVRSLTKVGTIAAGAQPLAGAQGKVFGETVAVTIPAASRRANVRAVVFVQARRTLAIVGAASVSMR